MKPFLGLQGPLLLLFFMKTCADDWSAIRLRCVNHWFYLRIKATLFANIFMEPNEVFLGIGCPVTTVWPNDVYDFTYRTYDCGIVNKVLYSVTLLQTKLTYISKNASLQAEMHLSCVLNTLNPLFCDAESRGDFTGNPPEWEVDMRVRRNEQAVLTVPPAVPAVPPAFQMVPPAVPAVPPAFQMVLQAVPVLMVPPAVPMVPPAVPTVPPAVPTVPPAVPTVPPAVLTVPPAVPMVPPNFSTSSEYHQISNQPQFYVMIRFEPAEVSTFMYQNLSVFHFFRM